MSLVQRAAGGAGENGIQDVWICFTGLFVLFSAVGVAADTWKEKKKFRSKGFAADAVGR